MKRLPKHCPAGNINKGIRPTEEVGTQTKELNCCGKREGGLVRQVGLGLIGKVLLLVTDKSALEVNICEPRLLAGGTATPA
jgi:hypothetical protein